MMKKGICLLLALCCLLLLSGCAGNRTEETREPVSTLPPAQARYIAPDGDGMITESREYRLYLPGRDGLRLVSRSVLLEAENLNDAVEKLMQQLLEYAGDNDAKPMGGTKPLELYGSHPIEISGGVCTVNLTRTAKELKLSDYYKNCLAIATTLCELSEINGVNVLVEDESIPLDTPGYLPMGTLMGHAGESLPVLWEQMEAKKTPMTPTNKDPRKNPLNALATLYYPLPDSRGMACTIRMVNFEGQDPAQLTVALMDEVSSIRRSMTGGQSFPELRDLLLRDPVTSDLPEGGRLLTLNLREDAESILEAARTDLACFAASMTYTLTTFIPGAAAVCIRIGDKPITELKTERFDAVTARAVASLPVLCELCIPYVKVGGVFLAMKTDEGELEAGKKAAKALGAVYVESVKYKLICENEEAERCIIIFKKTKNTDIKYPRRYSQIKAKPLQ